MPEKPTEDPKAWLKLTEQDAKGVDWEEIKEQERNSMNMVSYLTLDKIAKVS